MTSAVGQATIEHIGQQAREPSWITQLRARALQEHAALPWPSPSDEVWRRTNLALLDPAQGFSVAEESELLQRVPLTDAQRLGIRPLADEHLVVRADGAWISQQVPSGVVVGEIAEARGLRASLLQRMLEADGLSAGERKLTSLNTAFHRDGVFVDIPAGFTGEAPLRLVRLVSAKPQAAVFPLTVIVAGQGSSVVLIEEDTGLTDPSSPHLINGRIELVLEPQARVHYCRIQRWAHRAREFLLQRATLREGARLTMVNINLGAEISKEHVIARLEGAGAESRVFGFVFGHHQQHVDFHSLQDHQAPRTMSDLLYKAALADQSRMVYTGLIRIAKTAKQTDAYQANHNLLLSRQAKAETIPMLEILADDVRCKHGATIGPVDEEQLFYLMTRAVPRELAERLLVMGFVEPIIAQVPFEPMQQLLRQELEGTLRPAA